MARPPGVRYGLGPDGLTLSVARYSDAEDKVWDAVEAAIIAGWSPKRFMRAAEECWREVRRDELRQEMDEWQTK